MRKSVAAVAVIAALAAVVAGGWLWWHCRADWPAWHGFAETFVQKDGRIIEFTAKDRTTSEGQAYALFLALVAGDRKRFDRILQWTRDNLAQGDLHEHLPAWLWGQADDGGWQVLDANPASDADLWLAYTLLEAGRLWQTPEYTETAMRVMQLIADREVVQLPGAGQMLLPAPHGFHPDADTWRLNPSYLPPFLLARLAQVQPAGPWAAINATAARLLTQVAQHGLAPDWYRYDRRTGVATDSQTGPVGSYDAIRVYLWLDLWAQGPITTREMAGMVAQLKGRQAPPERVDVQTTAAHGDAPVGFSAALLPYLSTLGADKMLKAQQQRVRKRAGKPGDANARYYDWVLILFGRGWLRGHYHIGEAGRLVPRWAGPCCGLIR